MDCIDSNVQEEFDVRERKSVDIHKECDIEGRKKVDGRRP